MSVAGSQNDVTPPGDVHPATANGKKNVASLASVPTTVGQFFLPACSATTVTASVASKMLPVPAGVSAVVSQSAVGGAFTSATTFATTKTSAPVSSFRPIFSIPTGVQSTTSSTLSSGGHDTQNAADCTKGNDTDSDLPSIIGGEGKPQGSGFTFPSADGGKLSSSGDSGKPALFTEGGFRYVPVTTASATKPSSNALNPTATDSSAPTFLAAIDQFSVPPPKSLDTNGQLPKLYSFGAPTASASANLQTFASADAGGGGSVSLSGPVTSQSLIQSASTLPPFSSSTAQNNSAISQPLSFGLISASATASATIGVSAVSLAGSQPPFNFSGGRYSAPLSASGTSSQPSSAVPHLFGTLSGGGDVLPSSSAGNPTINQPPSYSFTMTSDKQPVASLSSVSTAGKPLMGATVAPSTSAGSILTSLFTLGNRASRNTADSSLVGSQAPPMFTFGSLPDSIATTVVTTSAVGSQLAPQFLFGGQSNVTAAPAAVSFGNQPMFTFGNQPAAMTANASGSQNPVFNFGIKPTKPAVSAPVFSSSAGAQSISSFSATAANSQSSAAFGSHTTTSTSFGMQPVLNAFGGQSTANTFGSSQLIGNMFGSQPYPTANAFGVQATTTAAPSMFGSPSLFGSSVAGQAQQPAFGTQTMLFGNQPMANQSLPANVFGGVQTAPAAAPSGFGVQQALVQNLFNTQQQQQPVPSIFGHNAAGSIFNASATQNSFNSSNTSTAFPPAVGFGTPFNNNQNPAAATAASNKGFNFNSISVPNAFNFGKSNSCSGFIGAEKKHFTFYYLGLR